MPFYYDRPHRKTSAAGAYRAESSEKARHDEAQALHHAKLENIKIAKAMIADSELIEKIKS